MYCFRKSPTAPTQELSAIVETTFLNFGSLAKSAAQILPNICKAPRAAIMKTKTIYGVKLTHLICKQKNKEAAYELSFIIYRNVHGPRFDEQL